MTPADEATVEAVAKALGTYWSSPAGGGTRREAHEHIENMSHAAITALDLPGIIRAAKVEALREFVALINPEPLYELSAESAVDGLLGFMAEHATTIENGVGDE